MAAAFEAGALIRARVGRAENVRHKGIHDLVTATDEEAQRVVLARLAEACPGYDVLAEEGAADTFAEAPGLPRWIVDPIDGTTNFTHGCPPYCVSIGLQDAGGELVLGVVYEVALDEMFAAVRGHGLTLNGRPAGVSATGRLSDALVTTGFPFREFGYVDAYLGVLRRFMEETRGVRRPGSAAADLAYLACGRFDVFFEAGLAPWDVAAGIVLVREGGGRVTGLTEGQDPLWGGQLTATNGALHEAAMALTRPLGAAHAGEGSAVV
jgi:myo-inositol-1(or 4)-monophosphatase